MTRTLTKPRDDERAWREAFPGSCVEHVTKGTGIYVLFVEAGGARRLSK